MPIVVLQTLWDKSGRPNYPSHLYIQEGSFHLYIQDPWDVRWEEGVTHRLYYDLLSRCPLGTIKMQKVYTSLSQHLSIEEIEMWSKIHRRL